MKRNRKRFISAVTAMILVVAMCIQPVAGAEDFSFSVDIGDGMDAGTGEGTQTDQGIENIPGAGTDQGTGEIPDTGAGQGTGENPDAGTDSGEEAPEFGSGSEAEPEIDWGDGSEVAEEITVVSFDELAEEVKNRETATGTPLEELGLPDSLGVSEIRAEASEAQPGTVENITWKVDPENPVNKEHAVTEYLPDQEGITVFTPVLPQNYVLAEGAVLPEIRVQVKKQEEKKQVILTAFDALDTEVERQEAEPGTTQEELNLPTSLSASSIEQEGAEPLSVTVENVTWKVDPEQEINKKWEVTEYQPEKEGYTVFTAVLPENYTVAENVKLPEITVEVRSRSTVSTYASREGDIEEATAFAMQDKLLNGFDTIATGASDETILEDLKGGFRASQQVFFGKDYQGEAQKWWITGTDPANSGNLVLFASDTLLAPMKFRDGDWESTKFPYETVDGREEYKFGTWKSSSVRKALENASNDPNLFSEAEKKLMVKSTIETLSRATLFKTEHPDMKLDDWDEFKPDVGTGTLFDWKYYTIFPKIDTDEERSNIHYAQKPELYYETEDILYAPYGEKEYAFPTVGSGHGTRASRNKGNAISRSFLIENQQSNQDKSGNGDEKMPFWLRSPGTYYTNNDNTGPQWHEIGRDCALLAGNFNDDNGDNSRSNIVIAHDFNSVEGQNLYANKEYAVQPAFQLDTSNVLFGSSAEAAANHAEEVKNGAALDVNEAMTLRYKDTEGELGTATVIESEPDENGNQHQQVEVKGAPEGTYLVVQDIFNGYNAGAWAIPVQGNMTISLDKVFIGDSGESVQDVIDAEQEFELGNDGFPTEYRIWLEKTEDGITKATLADYRVSVSGGKLIEISCEGETVDQNTNTSTQNFHAKSTYKPEKGYDDGETWIWEEDAKTVTCTAKEGYYFPQDYLEKHGLDQRKYGVWAKISEDRKTLTVTFESDEQSFPEDDAIFYFYAPYAARTIVLPTPEKIPQDLTISKTVVKDGADTAEEISSKAAAEKFNFTLSLKDESGKPLGNQELEITDINGKPGMLQLKDSSATFILSHNQQITVKNLPNGITYKITETPVEHYSPQYEITETDADHTKPREAISSESSPGDAETESSNIAGSQENSASVQGKAGIQQGNIATGKILLGKDVTVAYTNTYTPGYQVSFTKVDKETNKPLDGVKFKLYSCSNTDQGHTHNDLAGEDSGQNNCWKPIQTEGQDREYISVSNGKVDLGILEAGEYMLQETATVSGYVLPKGQWLLEVKDGGDISFTTKGDEKTPGFEEQQDRGWILPNVKKITAPLPGTGGSGTGMLYLSAMLILALTGSSFLYRRNKKQSTHQ